MKAIELANKLLEYSDLEVSVSIDISTSEDDAHKRAFSEEFYELMVERSKGTVVILFNGVVNE